NRPPSPLLHLSVVWGSKCWDGEDCNLLLLPVKICDDLPQWFDRVPCHLSLFLRRLLSLYDAHRTNAGLIYRPSLYLMVGETPHAVEISFQERSVPHLQ